MATVPMTHATRPAALPICWPRHRHLQHPPPLPTPRKLGTCLTTILKTIGVIALAGALAGCSVGMAMSGKPDPNLGAFGVGSSRGQVELQLGTAIASSTDERGLRTDIYEYEIGNAPSAGRAVGHAIMDVLMLGLWEFAGTPIEAFQGSKHRIAITYDPYDRVVGVNQPTASSLPAAAAAPVAYAAMDGQTPACRDAAIAAQCPFYQYRLGVYRAKCRDGSMLVVSLGQREITPPAIDVPRPWLAERCEIGGITYTAGQ